MSKSNSEHLFDMKLQHKKEMTEENPESGKLGKYLGSGDGTVKGSKINGTVIWNLYENQSPTVCDANIGGTITTDDGLDIQFNCLGFFKKDDVGSKWRMIAGAQFSTTADQYKWLNSILASWEGEFDMSTYKHNYSVFSREH